MVVRVSRVKGVRSMEVENDETVEVGSYDQIPSPNRAHAKCLECKCSHEPFTTLGRHAHIRVSFPVIFQMSSCILTPSRWPPSYCPLSLEARQAHIPLERSIPESIPSLSDYLQPLPLYDTLYLRQQLRRFTPL